MRLWSLHPKYLDPQGLVALWRETLLAQAVLRGETRGYRSHPQLERFKRHSAPRTAIAMYLSEIYSEAKARGYDFDRSKFKLVRRSVSLSVTSGQIEHEWKHLLKKLKVRTPVLYRKWRKTEIPDSHPMFRVRTGDVEAWERI